jgi:hypothetical protein
LGGGSLLSKQCALFDPTTRVCLRCARTLANQGGFHLFWKPPWLARVEWIEVPMKLTNVFYFFQIYFYVGKTEGHSYRFALNKPSSSP